jgi:hypothetical protein
VEKHFGNLQLKLSRSEMKISVTHGIEERGSSLPIQGVDPFSAGDRFCYFVDAPRNDGLVNGV